MFIACLVKRRPKSERREWEEQVRIGEEEEASRAATRNFWVDLCPFARPGGLRRDRLRDRGLQNDANDPPARVRAGAAPGRAANRARSSHVSAAEEDCSPPGGRGLSQFQAYCCLPLPLLHLLLLRLRNGKTHFQELIRVGRTRREGGPDGRADGRTRTPR